MIQPAVIGRSLNIDATIQTSKLPGQHTIPLAFDVHNPQLADNVTAEELGIREVVSQQTTYSTVPTNLPPEYHHGRFSLPR